MVMSPTLTKEHAVEAVHAPHTKEHEASEVHYTCIHTGTCTVLVLPLGGEGLRQ